MTTTHARSSLPMLDLDTAPPAARAVLERASRQVGMLPNMYRNMAHVPGLLETYLFGYERFRNESGLSPAEQEVVFLTISHENVCHYCVAAHSTLADTKSGVPRAVTDAIRDGLPILDARLAALSGFTRLMVRSRGWPTAEELEAFCVAGFTDHHVLAVILAISVKTLSNYSNHFAGTPVDAVFQDRAWTPPAEAFHRSG